MNNFESEEYLIKMSSLKGDIKRAGFMIVPDMINFAFKIEPIKRLLEDGVTIIFNIIKQKEDESDWLDYMKIEVEERDTLTNNPFDYYDIMRSKIKKKEREEKLNELLNDRD